MSAANNRKLAKRLGISYKKLMKLDGDGLIDACFDKMRRDGDMVFDEAGIWLRQPDGEYKLLPREQLWAN